MPETETVKNPESKSSSSTSSQAPSKGSFPKNIGEGKKKEEKHVCENPKDYDDLWQYVFDKCKDLERKGIDIESRSRNSGKDIEHFFIVKFTTEKQNEFSSRVDALKFAEKLAAAVRKL